MGLFIRAGCQLTNVSDEDICSDFFKITIDKPIDSKTAKENEIYVSSVNSSHQNLYYWAFGGSPYCLNL